MANVWFTADLHLGHGNIIKFCSRPFMSEDEEEKALEEPRGNWHVSEETIERHDDGLIGNINGLVAPDDTLWILGDFCWRKLDGARQYRDRIRCRNVNLVWGNHDSHRLRPLFSKTIDQGMVGVEGQKIWLNHYPMRSWDRSHHGSWHLYGHVHGRLDAEDEATPWKLTKDVGVDSCCYQPVNLEVLQEYMTPRIEAFTQRKFESKH